MFGCFTWNTWPILIITSSKPWFTKCSCTDSWGLYSFNDYSWERHFKHWHESFNQCFWDEISMSHFINVSASEPSEGSENMAQRFCCHHLWFALIYQMSFITLRRFLKSFTLSSSKSSNRSIMHMDVTPSHFCAKLILQLSIIDCIVDKVFMGN